MYFLRHGKGLVVSIVASGVLAISIAVASYLSERKSAIGSRNFEVLRIGVIDSIRLKTESKCFREHDKVAERILKLLAGIRKLSIQLSDKSMNIKHDKKLKARQKQSQLNKLNKEWQLKSTEYSKAMRKEKDLDKKLTDYIQNHTFKIIENVARKLKIDIVINKGSQDMVHVFYNSQNIDMTDIVIDELNKIIPTVDLKELE